MMRTKFSWEIFPSFKKQIEYDNGQQLFFNVFDKLEHSKEIIILLLFSEDRVDLTIL